MFILVHQTQGDYSVISPQPNAAETLHIMSNPDKDFIFKNITFHHNVTEMCHYEQNMTDRFLLGWSHESTSTLTNESIPHRNEGSNYFQQNSRIANNTSGLLLQGRQHDLKHLWSSLDLKPNKSCFSINLTLSLSFVLQVIRHLDEHISSVCSSIFKIANTSCMVCRKQCNYCPLKLISFPLVLRLRPSS